jgi:hypothetical protein
VKRRGKAFRFQVVKDVRVVRIVSGTRDRPRPRYGEASALVRLKIDPRFDAPHGEPRFQEILRQMGLPNT